MANGGEQGTWQASGSVEYPDATDITSDGEAAFRFNHNGDIHDPGEFGFNIKDPEDLDKWRATFNSRGYDLSAEEQRVVDDLVALGYDIDIATQVVVVDRAIG